MSIGILDDALGASLCFGMCYVPHTCAHFQLVRRRKILICLYTCVKYGHCVTTRLPALSKNDSPDAASCGSLPSRLPNRVLRKDVGAGVTSKPFGSVLSDQCGRTPGRTTLQCNLIYYHLQLGTLDNISTGAPRGSPSNQAAFTLKLCVRTAGTFLRENEALGRVPRRIHNETMPWSHGRYFQIGIPELIENELDMMAR